MPEYAGIKCHFFYNGVIEDNWFVGNYTSAVWLDNQYNGARISRNVMAYNALKGGGNRAIFIELSKTDTVVIDNNIIIGTEGDAFYCHDASNIKMVHNLIAHIVSCDRTKEKCGGEIWYARNLNRDNAYTRHCRFPNNLAVDVPRGHSIQSSSIINGTERIGDNLSDYNIYQMKYLTYDGGKTETSCWKISDGVIIGGSKETRFTLDRWRDVWHDSLDIAMDAHSKLMTGYAVTLDMAAKKMTITVPEEFTNFKTAPISGMCAMVQKYVKNDFLVNPIPHDGSALAGPFQDLTTGTHTFNLWDAQEPPTHAAGRMPEGTHRSTVPVTQRILGGRYAMQVPHQTTHRITELLVFSLQGHLLARETVQPARSTVTLPDAVRRSPEVLIIRWR
jgi:hypothetical protein